MNKVVYGGHQRPNSGPPRGCYGSAFYCHSRLRKEWQQEGGEGREERKPPMKHIPVWKAGYSYIREKWSVVEEEEKHI